MWVLITKLQPALPPQPQPPLAYRPENGDIEDFVHSMRLPVSYCPLLMDPNVHDYDWVDVELRQTIYNCMYHRPDDRPTLENLLAAAKIGAQKGFRGETDQYVTRWIQRWLL